jgi:hypothetical protein
MNASLFGFSSNDQLFVLQNIYPMLVFRQFILCKRSSLTSNVQIINPCNIFCMYTVMDILMDNGCKRLVYSILLCI